MFHTSYYNEAMITPTYTKELELLKNYRLIAGIDEVGRAPLAGPVVSAVVILNPEKVGKYRSRTKWWQEVRDSKALSAAKRESLIDFIKDNAHDFAIGAATHKEIDELNIHEASLLSMRRAVERLKIVPEVILIDGRFKIPLPQSLPRGEGKEIKNNSSLLSGGGKVGGIKQQPIIDGDAHVLSIAAASILAKVYRDDLMRKYSRQFPEYGFEKHKGYDTSFHRNKLLEHGPCEIHRMSFETVKEAVSKRFKKMLE